jgi:hypothetical protein
MRVLRLTTPALKNVWGPGSLLMTAFVFVVVKVLVMTNARKRTRGADVPI